MGQSQEIIVVCPSELRGFFFPKFCEKIDGGFGGCEGDEAVKYLIGFVPAAKFLER